MKSEFLKVAPVLADQALFAVNPKEIIVLRGGPDELDGKELTYTTPLPFEIRVAYEDNEAVRHGFSGTFPDPVKHVAAYLLDTSPGVSRQHGVYKKTPYIYSHTES